jgi:hypothetical protein
MQVFELPRFEHALNQVAQTMIARKTKARNAPSRNVTQAQRPAGSHDAGQRCAARVRRAQDASHAGSSDTRDWYAVLLQHSQHAQMRETAREAAA